MSQLAPGAGVDNEACVKFNEIIRSLDFLTWFILSAVEGFCIKAK